VNKPSWKSVVFDELHLIREKMTKEMNKIKTKKEMEEFKKREIEKLKKDGYISEKSPNGYNVIRKI